MRPTKWDRVGEVYHGALSIEPEGRAAFLDEECAGDGELRREVESLLGRASDASGFLETPALELAGRALASQRPPSLIGRRLGQYDIRSFIGAGGMGEVYLARDLTLERDVAIKCLPEYVAADPNARARLRREARLLATLNHPNIASIHGVEEAEGVIGLVLELVEGPTLAERVGTMSLREALGIARQIADALEAAHEKGIVHRDLKPTNIKITSAGTAKVLDFGLAKALEEGAQPAAEELTAARTRAGVILGTPAYMSPEQARGKNVDRRTDVWAFGCVLYELLAGRSPFGHENSTDALVKVLESDPDWNALPTDTPAPIRRLLRRCLEKDVALRLRDIADARLEIVEALSPVPAGAPMDTPVARRRWVGTALAVAAIAAIGAGGYAAVRGTSSAAVGEVTRLTFRQGMVGRARFAADGQTVVYGASWDGEPFRVYSTVVGSGQSRAIDLPSADLLALSSQGQVALSMGRPAVDGWEPRGTLAVTALAGGAPRELYKDIVGADWSPDGKTMAIVRRSGTTSRLEFPVGTVVHENPVILPPRVSPDGEHLCFFGGYGVLWLADRAGRVRQLANDLGRGGHCAWTPDGREIWADGGGGAMHMTLVAFDLAGRRRQLASYTGFVQIEDIAADGKVLLAAGTLRYSVHAFDRRVGRERDLTVFDASRTFHLTADGRQVLIWDNSPAARNDRVFLRSVDGTPAIPLGPGAPAALLPDGEWAAAISDGKTNQRNTNKLTLFPISVGVPRTLDLPMALNPLTAASLGHTNWAGRTYDFSADGTRLLIPSGNAPGRPPRVYVYDLPRKTVMPITQEGITGPAVISPDGRFVAVNEHDHIVIHAVEGGEGQRSAGPPEPGYVAAWSADGRSLFTIEQADTLARVFRRDVATGQRALIREIRVPSTAGVTALDVFVSRDGQGYAYTSSVRQTNLFVVSGLR